MRFYLNLCFNTRFSLDNKTSQKLRRINDNMPHKERLNFKNQPSSCNTSNGSTGTTNDERSSMTKHEDATFELVDNFQRQDDSLAMEYRSGTGSPGLTTRNTKSNNKKHRQRNTRLFLCLGFLLIILIAVVVLVVCLQIARKDDGKCKGEIQGESGAIVTSQKNNSISSTNNKENGNSNKGGEEEVCRTEKCHMVAQNLLKSMNLSVDPCQDFHQFACGSWPLNYELPPSYPKFDTMGILNVQKNEYLRDVIVKESAQRSHKPITAGGFKSKLLDYYQSCSNLDQIDSRGSAPLLKFIAQLGRWAPLKQWRQQGVAEPSITELLIESHQYFPPSVYDDRVKSPMFKTIVKVNDKNSKQHLLEVRERGKEYLSLEDLQKSISRTSILPLYLKYIKPFTISVIAFINFDGNFLTNLILTNKANKRRDS